MLSKSKQKFIRQLSMKKHRDAEGCFLAEGPKVVGELLQAFPCRLLCATADYLDTLSATYGVRPQKGERTTLWDRNSCRIDYGKLSADHEKLSADYGKGVGGRTCGPAACEVVEVTQAELAAASQLTTPQQVLAVLDKQRLAPLPCGDTADGTSLTLALDGVQDPGNLGTILRVADWFGIRRVVCSPDTADAYAPKVVQATMGALARVDVSYTCLPEWLAAQPSDTPIYGTFLNGTDIYAQPLTRHGIIVMGNEGKGISQAVANLINRRLLIPSFPAGQPTSESLNVATATAIVCSEFRRRCATAAPPCHS
ncbi:MAG: RNA methyltransferase [Bacteroidaceae bacterium]|nr:RNA methyltransferase [Bacteroidaceae bacterium]